MKTEHMLVKSNVSNNDENVLKIRILRAYLENVEEYNYLGLLIDNALKFVNDEYKRCVGTGR